VEAHFRDGWGTPGDYRSFFVPTQAGAYTFTLKGKLGNQKIDLVDPSGPNRFTATVADFDSGTTLHVDRVELSGTPVSHPDLGTARPKLTETADGRWLGQGRLLSLAGRWDLTTTIQRPDGGVTVPLAVDVPAPAPS
jgi:hypothetical protein